MPDTLKGAHETHLSARRLHWAWMGGRTFLAHRAPVNVLRAICHLDCARTSRKGSAGDVARTTISSPTSLLADSFGEASKGGGIFSGQLEGDISLCRPRLLPLPARIAAAAAASPALRLLPHAQCHTLVETRLRFGSPLRRSLEATAVLTTACLGSDRPASQAVRGSTRDPAQPHPQLLHHFARRSRQEHARRPPDGHDRRRAQR